MTRDETNKRIHAALGLCVHKFKTERTVTMTGDRFDDIVCKKCGHETGEYAPDYPQKIPDYLADGNFVVRMAVRKGDRQNLGEELADAVIRVADICHQLGINLEKEIAEKMAYNAKRPRKHNKIA